MKNKNKRSLQIQLCMNIIIYHLWLLHTCSEFRMQNIQANTLDPWLTAKRPNAHVIPIKGSSIIVAFMTFL